MTPLIKRLIFKTLATVAGLFLPFLIRIHHLPSYYTVLGAAALFGLLEEALGWRQKRLQHFIRRWEKKRTQHKGLLFLEGMAQGFLLMLVLVTATQFWLNGLSPAFMLACLSARQKGWVLALFLAFSVLVGLTHRLEYEKTYQKLKQGQAASEDPDPPR